MTDKDTDKRFLSRAIALAGESMERGGGPFGAVVTRDGIVLAEASNSVVPLCDPTAHAEVCAIRQACQREHSFDLSGCTLYASCEPCPMCLGAVYWARVSRVVYAASRADAAAAGFDDDFIYRELEKTLPERTLPLVPMLSEEGRKVLEAWRKKEDKAPY